MNSIGTKSSAAFRLDRAQPLEANFFPVTGLSPVPIYKINLNRKSPFYIYIFRIYCNRRQLFAFIDSSPENIKISLPLSTCWLQ